MFDGFVRMSSADLSPSHQCEDEQETLGTSSTSHVGAEACHRQVEGGRHGEEAWQEAV